MKYVLAVVVACAVLIGVAEWSYSYGIKTGVEVAQEFTATNPVSNCLSEPLRRATDA